ncbi:hypothetical protein [Luteibacter rhizovicinus]|nr:hypothetical protein [Luteibacter rhizovicinus]
MPAVGPAFDRKEGPVMRDGIDASGDDGHIMALCLCTEAGE